MFEQTKTSMMTLDQQIAKFMEKEQLLPAKSKVLVAVSGGIDSMVLLHVLKSLDFDVGCAHINYKLRGHESEQDQLLIEAFCQKIEMPLFLHPVTPEESEQLQNGNLQEVARDIRYHFFEKVCREFQYQFIATGHHCNDQVETFFLNLLRGSGLKGLSSIRVKRHNIIRPLLKTSQEDIIQYANQNQIPYRDDRSNAEDQYNRNYLRHHIIPKLEERWTDAIDQIATSVSIIGNESQLLYYFIDSQRSKWISEGRSYSKVGPISRIIKIPGGKSLLYYLLKPYHISPDQIMIMTDTEPQSGADFSNDLFDILLDRDHLLIRKPQDIPSVNARIERVPQSLITSLGEILLENADTYFFDQKTDQQFLNGEAVHFPLTIRNWRHGDKWQPLGMSGHKLISDTLIDYKINQFEKGNIIILEDSHGHIIWVSSVGISDLVKISKTSRDFIKLTWFANITDDD